MDRQIVYPGSIPLDTDILNIQRNVMVALGYLAQAAIGSGTYADGLTPFQTTVPSMAINIGPGSIVALQTIDATAFGSLSSDNVNPLMKMSINKTTILSSTFGTMTAPVTTGQSINYLIQASTAETDTTAVVLPYYNSSNPAVPYSGPANSGTSQNTQRLQPITFGLKAGSPATTGTQVTPSPDSGFIGLYVVTVAYAQTTILNANITLFPTAPILGTKVGTMRRKLTQNTNLYVNGTTGSDTNNGLASTTAFLTLQGAWNFILSSLDLANFAVTVNVSDGSYAPVLLAGNPVAGGFAAVSFVGNTTTPANCTVTATNASCFAVVGAAQISLAGFKLSATGTGAGQGYGVFVNSSGSVVNISGKMELASCAGADLAVTLGGQINVTSAYTISGTSGSAWFCNGPGIITNLAVAITLSGTPSFTSAALADSGGQITFNGTTFTGSATGTKYVALHGGFINTNSSGNVNFLPGNSAGSSPTGYYG
jgi:hypothetical protein